MIGIYKDVAGGQDERIPMGFNGLTINDEIYPVGIVAIGHRYDAVTEPMAQTDGMEAYPARRMVTMVRAEGVVRADTMAQFHDRIEALNIAFDPVLAADDGSTERAPGFLPFTFSTPTANPSYASGLRPMQYYVRSLALPVGRWSKFEGEGARYTLELQAVDPRRYSQFNQNLTLTALTGAADNTLATYPSYPVVRVNMGAGSGPAYWFISNLAIPGSGLHLDLSSLTAGSAIDIDMRRKTITLVSSGANKMDTYLSGDFFHIEPAVSNTIQIDNLTNMTNVVVTWRKAFL